MKYWMVVLVLFLPVSALQGSGVYSPPWLVRLESTHSEAWLNAVAASAKTYTPDSFRAYFQVVADSNYLGKHWTLALEQLPSHYPTDFVFFFDSLSAVHPEGVICCVLLDFPAYPRFWVRPQDLWVVENNLSTGNLDFAEFTPYLDQDSVFRRW